MGRSSIVTVSTGSSGSRATKATERLVGRLPWRPVLQTFGQPGVPVADVFCECQVPVVIEQPGFGAWYVGGQPLAMPEGNLGPFRRSPFVVWLQAVQIQAPPGGV